MNPGKCLTPKFKYWKILVSRSIPKQGHICKVKTLEEEELPIPTNQGTLHYDRLSIPSTIATFLGPKMELIKWFMIGVDKSGNVIEQLVDG